VEKDGQIYLYCKGADTKIKERLANSQDELIQITDQHLNVRLVLFFLFFFILTFEDICQ